MSGSDSVQLESKEMEEPEKSKEKSTTLGEMVAKEEKKHQQQAQLQQQAHDGELTRDEDDIPPSQSPITQVNTRENDVTFTGK